MKILTMALSKCNTWEHIVIPCKSVQIFQMASSLAKKICPSLGTYVLAVQAKKQHVTTQHKHLLHTSCEMIVRKQDNHEM